MAEEEIPLHPFDPHQGEHEGEEHETSFGGHDNTVLPPDYCDSDKQTSYAKTVIAQLRQEGLHALTDVYYAYLKENHLTIVSEDHENWYSLEKGAGGYGEELVGLIPQGDAPPPPDSLKLKFGLEVDPGDDETTPLISDRPEMRAQLRIEAINDVTSKFPEIKLALLDVTIGNKGEVLVCKIWKEKHKTSTIIQGKW